MTRPRSRPETNRLEAIATRRLEQAQHDHITHCPYCSTTLDYSPAAPRHAATAEVAYLLPPAAGGADTYTNTHVTCARCVTIHRASLTRHQLTPQQPPTITPRTSRKW